MQEKKDKNWDTPSVESGSKDFKPPPPTHMPLDFHS